MIRNPAAIRRSIERCERELIEWRERRARLRRELRVSVERVERCEALRDQGLPFRAIGVRLGITAQMVYQILNPHIGIAKAERERLARRS